MPKYVAFLRAINVGGHTVKMDRLRSLFETMGFSAVATFIASGNVIFDSPSRSASALEKKIASSLQAALGYAVAAFLRSLPELAAIAAYKPFTRSELGATGSTLYVAFAAGPPGDEAGRALSSSATEVDDFRVHGREVYWLRRRGLSDAEFPAPPLEKILGMQVTLRNSNTINKIVSKYA